MDKLYRWLKKNNYVFLLLFIELILFLTNVKFGTYFVGWDNLLPELNFHVNLPRSLFGVWQESRGLGLLDGMSFAANLPHHLFLYLLSFILPQNLLRYFFVFLMHFLGGWGMFKLLSGNLFKDANDNGKDIRVEIASLAGALFYLFNLATVQMFFAPYELFLVHFGILPWLANYLIRFLRDGQRKDLILFGLFSILAIPQAHVPTIFITYMMFVGVVLLTNFFRRNVASVKRALIVLAVIFCFNGFWVLPFAYATTQDTATITNAKINQSAGENIFLKNKARGNLLDIVYLKGFMLDEVEQLKTGESDFIMKAWRLHTQTNIFKITSTIFGLLALFGLLNINLTKDGKWLSFVISSGVAFFFLGTDIPVIKLIIQGLRDNSSLFREVFRFSFTKFSILFVFGYSIFLGWGVFQIVTLYGNFVLKNGYRFRKYLLFVILGVVFVSYAYPALEGNFLYDSERLNIPQDYFKTINYFKHQDRNTRIALFPQPSYWSWKYYSWGERGSGFIWYGLPQATLDRAFDPWSSFNENYYWEMTYALYSKNINLFNNILEKYQINWLMVDDYMTNPISPKALYLDELKELLKGTSKVKLDSEFGRIHVYKVFLNTPVHSFVYLGKDLPVVGPKYNWNNLDLAYNEHQFYVSSLNSDTGSDYYYPFRSLFTGKNQENVEVDIREDEFSIIFTAKLPKTLKSDSLKIPDLSAVESTISGRVVPKVIYRGDEIDVVVPKLKQVLRVEIVAADQPSVTKAQACNALNMGTVENRIIDVGANKYLRVLSTGAINCSAAFWLPNLGHDLGYLFSIETRNIAGRTLHFWLENLDQQKEDLETYLPRNQDFKLSYFLQPPMIATGSGYTVHLDGISINKDTSINDVGRVSVTAIPFRFLTELSLDNNTKNYDSRLESVHVQHPMSAFYNVGISSGNADGIKNRLLILSQASDAGWVAIAFQNGSSHFLNNKVAVNNWSNGWLIGNGALTVYIIYWPQLLQILGYGLFIVGLVWCLRRRY